MGELRKSATKRLEGIQGNFEELRGTAQEQLAGAAEVLSGAGQRIRSGTDQLLAQAGINDSGEAEGAAPLSSRISQHGEMLRQQTTELQTKASEQLESARQAAEAATSKLKEQTSELLQTPASEHLADATAAWEASTKSLWKQASQNWTTLTGVVSGAPQDAYGYEVSEEDSDPERTAREAMAASGREHPMNRDAGSSVDKAPQGEAVSTALPTAEDAAGTQEAAKETEVAAPEAPAPVPVASVPEGPKSGEPEEAIIIAEIVLEDGAVETIRISARDRCKDVAHRFVQERSLKAWFEEPLCKYLKKVEREAEKFPVNVKEELSEIRTQFK